MPESMTRSADPVSNASILTVFPVPVPEIVATTLYAFVDPAIAENPVFQTAHVGVAGATLGRNFAWMPHADGNASL